MKRFIIGFMTLSMLIMIAGISNAQNLTTPRCVEDDSGSIDIAGTSAICGGNVTVPVRIQNTPNEADSVGFEVSFDPAALTYLGFEKKGALAGSFAQFDVSKISTGVIRCGGFKSSDEIEAGTSGDLVYLNFSVVSDCSETKLEIGELKDDIKLWSASSGCFKPADKCSGDINEDGETTPQDALCAFEKYMGVCPTSCEIDCADVCCDVNSDSECTPADALCIFNKYLGKPECGDNNPVAFIELIATPTVILADGTSTSTIAARVMRADGTKAADGTEIVFEIIRENPDDPAEDVGTLGAALSVTVSTFDGVAYATLTSGKTPRKVTIRAQSGMVASEIQVEYTTPNTENYGISLEAHPAGGGSEYILEATVYSVIENSADPGPGIIGVPVMFGISDETGTISPVIAVTGTFGIAVSVFTPIGSDWDTVTITATVQNTSVTDSVIVENNNNTPVTLMLSRGTSISSPDSNTYKLPMSVFAIDSEGNPVPNVKVSLNTWPYEYSTGQWITCPTDNSSCCMDITGRFLNEDVNRNLILDEGEDKDENGMLTPPIIAAGSVQPSVIVTDQSGMADFSLFYGKSMAGWIKAEITASAVVSGTDIQTSVKFWMGWAVEDGCSLPDSPFGGEEFFISGIMRGDEVLDSDLSHVTMNTEQRLSITVMATNRNKVRFATTFGVWDGSNSEVTDVDVNEDGTATAIFKSAEAGIASVEVFDVDNPSISDILKLTITAPVSNTPPEVSIIPNQITDEDTPIVSMITVSDKEGGSLKVSVSSSNSALVPNDYNHININGFGQSYIFQSSPNETVNLSLEIMPAVNMHGVTELVVTVDDGDNEATRIFMLKVNPVNDPPVITPILDHRTYKNTSTEVPFSITGLEQGNITVSASSDNPVLVPNDYNHIDISGFGMEHNLMLSQGVSADLFLKITPAAHQVGTARITVKAGNGISATSSFLVIVHD